MGSGPMYFAARARTIIDAALLKPEPLRDGIDGESHFCVYANRTKRTKRRARALPATRNNPAPIGRRTPVVRCRPS